MSVTLKLDNYPSLNIKESTALDADSAIGATSLLVVNNQNIANGDYVRIGVAGSETNEIRTVSATSTETGITTDPTVLKHTRFDPIAVLRGNKLRIYTAPNVSGITPADSAFTTLLATVDIDPDQLSTIYIDATGSSAIWYKYVFYNSTTLAETDKADSGAIRGGNIGNYVTLDAIRNEAGFVKNRNISDMLIDTFRQQAQDELNGALAGLYSLPFVPPINKGIERITMMMAAGYLEIDQYGATFNINTNGVNNKVAWAYAQIEKIKSGQTQVTDQNGSTTAISGAHGFNGYPNGSTAADTQGAEDFMFKRSSIAGYSERTY